MALFDDLFSQDTTSSEEPYSDVLITQSGTDWGTSSTGDSGQVTTTDQTASTSTPTSSSTSFLDWLKGVTNSVATTASAIGSAVKSINSADQIYQSSAGVANYNPANQKTTVYTISTTEILMIGAGVFLLFKLIK